MVLEGGVAGAQPLHKGGRLRPTAKKQREMRKQGRWLATFKAARFLRLSGYEVTSR